jgi:hypothetical protein
MVLVIFPIAVSNEEAKQGAGIIPPYPLIGEAFIEHANTQQRALITGVYLAEQHNMEIDAFGYARFRAYSDPFESRAETIARPDNVETTRAPTTGPTFKSEYNS